MGCSPGADHHEPPPVDRIAGHLRTGGFDHDGGRAVTAYLPPLPATAVVFAGDGELIAGWGGLLEAAGVRDVAIVGAHRSGAEDEMVRIAEYSPTLDPDRFAAHERFLVDDVGDWARADLGLDLPVGRTAVAGVSAGAELSLALGLRHPTVYGSVFAASPGAGYRPHPLPASLPRVYLTAGTGEPFFTENAHRWYRALRSAGADVVMTTPAGGHGDPFWSTEFTTMVRWALGG